MTHPPLFARLRMELAPLAVALALVATGCAGGSEGERCNPSLSHDECNAGLRCQQPSSCVESYCCPDPASSSENPYCNGALCPAPDGGGDAGGH